MFKVHYRMQTGVGLYFAANATIALDHIKQLNAAGATSIKVTDAAGQRFAFEALGILRVAELTAPLPEVRT